jgi:hypothetical protein
VCLWRVCWLLQHLCTAVISHFSDCAVLETVVTILLVVTTCISANSAAILCQSSASVQTMRTTVRQVGETTAQHEPVCVAVSRPAVPPFCGLRFLGLYGVCSVCATNEMCPPRGCCGCWLLPRCQLHLGVAACSMGSILLKTVLALCCFILADGVTDECDPLGTAYLHHIKYHNESQSCSDLLYTPNWYWSYDCRIFKDWCAPATLEPLPAVRAHCVRVQGGRAS